MLTSIFIAAVLVAIAFFILLGKLGLRRVIRYHVAIDILVSAILSLLFVGTMSGMLIALAGGIVFSLALWVTRIMIPAEKEVPLFGHGKGWKGRVYEA